MRLKNILVGTSVILVGLGLFLAACLIVGSFYFNRSTENIFNSIEEILAAEELRTHLRSLSRQDYLLEMTGEKNYEKKKNLDELDIRKLRDKVRLHFSTDVEENLINKIDSETGAFLQLSQTPNSSGPFLTFQTGGLVLQDIETDIQELISLNIKRSSLIRNNLKTAEFVAKNIAIVIVMMLLIIPIGLIFRLRVLFYKPFFELKNTMIKFIDGDIKARLHKDGLVEIQEISMVYNEMADSICRQRESQLCFLASVAHDLRNPLNAIRMSSEFLMLEEFEHKETLQIIKRQTIYLDRMVGDLLDRTRIEAGQLELKKELCDVVPLISDIVRLFEPLYSMHQFNFVNPHSKIEVLCDPLRIGQAFSNLISNAAKYSPQGGVINIELIRIDGYLQISTSDQGLGINEDELEKIFEPFNRSKITRDTIPGVGLGLSVVRRIIEAHGGRISLNSALGKGSKFTLHLPM